MSSLLLPLSLGVFTIVITFQQQSAAQRQRIEDRDAAELQRAEDRNASRLQREQDKQEAELLRKQEKDLDKQRYENGRFDAYIQQMGKLLKESNGSIMSSQVTATLARIETLNIFRQLDPQRNVQIIRFLYEAKQLTDTPENPSLDLSTAKLLKIDFRDAAVNEKQLDQLSLRGIFLLKATFIGIKMSNINFSRTKFDTTNFSLAEIHDADFSFAEFYNTSFTSTSFSSTIFAEATFKNVNFSCKNIRDVDFKHSTLAHADFSFSVVYNADFSSASLENVNFSHTLLFNPKFPSATLKGVDFSLAELYNPDFSNAQLTNLNFASTNLIVANVTGAKVFNTNFHQSSGVASIFNYTSLSDCDFWHSNLKHAVFYKANLNQVNFSRANLYKTNFTYANMAKSELNNTLSIQDAILPNETSAHDENLVKDGQADCNISHISGWTLSNGNITTVISNKSSSNCQFTLQSLSIGATMYQRVSLSDKWDSNFWTHSEAVLSAKMSTGVLIDLKGLQKNNSVSSKETLSSNEEQINLLLHNDIWELEVFIKFNATASHSNMNNYWCDDIKLYIIYGTYLELRQVNIPANATWNQNGVTIAGGHGQGTATDQLFLPRGLFVDGDQTVVIADYWNHRIMQWKNGDTTNGQVVAGGNGEGKGLHQLQYPTDVLIGKEADSLIICDRMNERVVQWSRLSGTTQGEILIDNIDCFGLAMDEHRYLYVSDYVKHEVRRYQLGEKNGTLVAGGNGKGNDTNQLNEPAYLFVDRKQTVYVSDHYNHRVMKWNKGAKEGIVAAGGQGEGSALTQLKNPNGIFVDTLGTLYVADTYNHRVMRWTQGDKKQGTVIVGGNGKGEGANQFSGLYGFSFDRQDNLYVVDMNNDRVQRFSIE
ncbi:unnamed protein product [Rotaria socialis]